MNSCVTVLMTPDMASLAESVHGVTLLKLLDHVAYRGDSGGQPRHDLQSRLITIKAVD